MSIFRETPPTAGFPLYIKDFLSILSKENRAGSLEDDFKNYLNAPYAKTVYSGTAAFYLILESLKKISPKKTVIIPAFICPLVPLATQRAGLKTVVCDINKDNFDFDLQKLQDLSSKNDDILAILAVHLGGIPVDFEKIEQIAQKGKIFIIEDCAQSLGAEYKSKKTGILGDFSFFSLCRGKGLTIYEGGIITTKNERYCAVIDDTIKLLVKNGFFSESLKILELFGYWAFYRPHLFWWAYRLPQLFWDWQDKHLKAVSEYFTVDFPMHDVSKTRKSLGHITFKRLESEISKQRQKVSVYTEKLKNIPGIKLLIEPPGSKANYPYLTLLFNDPQKCAKIKEAFRKSGLGVSQIYALAITDYDYLKGIIGNTQCPNARFVAENHIALTTSAFLRNKDLDSVVNIIKNV